MRGLRKPLVLMLTLCVKCWAMSRSEVEDFSNFLRKTSVLDQNLKDGFGSHEADEVEEAVSDDAWEQSGKFEGDLILNDRQRRLIVEDVAEGLSRNGLKDSTKRWPDNEVTYYIQKEHFNSDQVRAIQDGIDDLAQASCVKFRPYQKGDRDAVVIQGSRRGCFSQVGYQGGYQVLNLSGRHPVGRGCFRHGTVVHELLHTLGFFHMQSSPDRDDYIDVVWENIVQPARHNFKKYNTFSVSDFGVGYDYESVLHYGRRAFSTNGQDTLVPKQGGAEIGQRVGLSDKDTQKLNKMYCDSDSNDPVEEEVPQKHYHKKKPSNQPFQGHGIGYHQGKALVIKLPAAETFSLTDKSIHKQMFDYFSKSPKAVLPKFVQEFGAGKKVNEYPMKSLIDNSDDLIKELNKKHDKDFSKFTKDIKTTTHQLANKKTPKISHGVTSESSTNEEEEDDDLELEKFNLYDHIAELDKIVTAKVYPSQKDNDNFLFYKQEYNGFLPKDIEKTTQNAPKNYENNLSEIKQTSTHEEDGDDFESNQFDDNVHNTDHPIVNNNLPKNKKEDMLKNPQIITTTTDKYDEDEKTQEELKKIIIAKVYPSQKENVNFPSYENDYNVNQPKHGEITTLKETNISPNDDENECDSKESTTLKGDGDDFGTSRFDGHDSYKVHQIINDDISEFKKEYKLHKHPQIVKITTDKNNADTREFSKSDSAESLADDDDDNVFALKSVQDHFTDLDKAIKGNGASLGKDDSFLSYRNAYNRLNNLRKGIYFPKSENDKKSDDETYNDQSFLFGGRETDAHLIPKHKKRGQKYQYYNGDDSYHADTFDGYPEDESPKDNHSENPEEKNSFNDNSDYLKKHPYKYQPPKDSNISYVMHNNLINKSIAKNNGHVDDKKENKSEQQVIKKVHDCIEDFKEDNADLSMIDKNIWNPIKNVVNKSSKIAIDYTSSTDRAMDPKHSREESKSDYNPKSEVIILKQHELLEEIGMSPGKKKLEPMSLKENTAKIVRHANIKTLTYSSAEKLDHDVPFSTVQPVRYEVINYLPYTSNDAYSRDTPNFHTYDIKNKYLSYPNRFPNDYQPYSYDSNFDPDFRKHSYRSSPQVFY